MTAESAKKFDLLAQQAAGLMAVFGRAGHEAIAPAILQPADVYLEAIGEDLRSRSYVFTDLDGIEMCLRPDLTVPTCRLYLERYPDAATRAKFAYNGPCFRYQPRGEDSTHPREFRQAGLESFNATDPERAEADIVALTAEALRGAGLRGFRLRLGDLSLFHSLLAATAMPERWRRRLARDFWRPERFRARLATLTGQQPFIAGADPALIGLARSLPADDLAAAEEQVARHLASCSITAVGVRSIEDVAQRLVDWKADLEEPPLAAAAAVRLESLLAIDGRPDEAMLKVATLAREAGLDLDTPIGRFQRRLALLREAGVDPAACHFSAEFGRNLEYYTGFVFQIDAPEFSGSTESIAGGGRYDRLLRAVGAPADVPAVGAAVHTERLLAVVRGEMI